MSRAARWRASRVRLSRRARSIATIDGAAIAAIDGGVGAASTITTAAVARPLRFRFYMVAFVEYHRSSAPASPPSPPPPTPPPARHGIFYDTERQEEERQRRDAQENERRHCMIVGPDSDGRYWAYPIYGGEKRPLRYHVCYHGGYMAV